METTLRNSTLHNGTQQHRELFRPETASRRTISYGDRVFVRVTSRGSVLLEMYTDRVEGLTELIGEVRSRLHGVNGLAKLWIRNHNRGWSTERPIMFYAPTRTPSVCKRQQQAQQTMLAPWETH